MKLVTGLATLAFAALCRAQNATDNSTLFPLYPCNPGSVLSFAIGNVTLPSVTLDVATTYFSNWTGTAPTTDIIRANGTNETGAVRTAAVPAGVNVTGTPYLAEILVISEVNATNGRILQVWNTTTEAIVLANLTIATASSDLSVYTNATTNLTTIEFYSNMCTSRQSLGLPFVREYVAAALAFWSAALTGNATATA